MASAMVREQGAALDRLVDRFAERAGKLGVRVHRLAILDEIAELAAELVKDGGPAAFAPPTGEGWRAVVAPALDAAEPTLRQHLTARGVTLVEAIAEQPRTASVGVAVGISAALHGVAETGTTIVADRLADRLVRMLAPKHILVLHRTDLLPSLDEAGERLRVLANAGPDAPGRYVSFITGPSRTADIEMSLTVGAHGPAELHIAILGAAQR
ncbi:MAG TPA: lactate utilization protein [Thermomicrobiales bacterium]|jgi:L-lactate dehydrogenase complex protein LldG